MHSWVTPNSPRPSSFPSSYLRRMPSPMGSGRTRLGGWKSNLRERLVEETNLGLDDDVLLWLLFLLLTGLFPKGEPFNGDETQLPMGSFFFLAKGFIWNKCPRACKNRDWSMNYNRSKAVFKKEIYSNAPHGKEERRSFGAQVPILFISWGFFWFCYVWFSMFIWCLGESKRKSWKRGEWERNTKKIGWMVRSF